MCAGDLLNMKEVEGIWEGWHRGASYGTHFQWGFSLGCLHMGWGQVVP